MTEHAGGACLEPNQVALLLDVYEAALSVAAEYPEWHMAGVAARRIIAAVNGDIPDGIGARPRFSGGGLRDRVRPHHLALAPEAPIF